MLIISRDLREKNDHLGHGSGRSRHYDGDTATERFMNESRACQPSY